MAKRFTPTEFVTLWEERVARKQQQRLPYTAIVTSRIGVNTYRIQRPDEDTTQTLNVSSVNGFELVVNDRVLVLPLDDEVDVILGRFAVGTTSDIETGTTVEMNVDSTAAFVVRTAAGSSRFRVDTTAGEFKGWNGADLVLFSGAGTGEVARIDGSTGDTTVRDISVRDIDFRHPIATGTVPGVAAGAAAGTTPSVSASGSDAAFRVVLTTGTATTTGTLFTVTFTTAWTGTEYEISCHAGDSDASATMDDVYSDYLSRSTTAFDFKTRTALPISTSHIFFFTVVEAV